MKKIILAVQVEPMLGVITQEAVYTLNKSRVHLSKLLNSLFSGHHTQIKETTLLEKKKNIHRYPNLAKDHLDDLQPIWESVDRTMRQKFLGICTVLCLE